MHKALIVCLLLVAGVLSGQSDSAGTLRGTVTDLHNGEPLIGAVIYPLNAQGGCVTDINGFYELKNLNAGPITIVVRMTGYHSDTAELQIKAKSIHNQYFRLVEEADSVVIYAPPGDLRVRRTRIDTILDISPIPEPQVINKKRFTVVTGVQTVLVAGSLIGLHQLWYKQYPRTTFHTFNDNAEWMQMDKIGHVQSAYTIGFVSSEMWRWTGMKHKKRTWIGGLTGFGYLTAIEIMDGYSSGWGFSMGDLIANAAGSGLFITQELLWQHQRILPKFGFRRSGYATYRPDLLGNGYHEEILKDYNGQTYWLSVNVASFLSPDTRFPRWLNIALGYGANGMTGGHENPTMYNAQGNEISFDRYRQYYLSFDIDLRRIPPPHSRFLRAFFNCFAFIKIPAPGIELSKYGVRPLLFAF